MMKKTMVRVLMVAMLAVNLTACGGESSQQETTAVVSEINQNKSVLDRYDDIEKEIKADKNLKKLKMTGSYTQYGIGLMFGFTLPDTKMLNVHNSDDTNYIYIYTYGSESAKDKIKGGMDECYPDCEMYVDTGKYIIFINTGKEKNNETALEIIERNLA